MTTRSLRFPLVVVLVAIFGVIACSSFGYASSAFQATFLEPVGQEQVLLTASVNMAVGISWLAIMGQLENFVERPGDWCNPDTELSNIRPRQEPFSIIGSLAVIMGIGKYKYGIDGDYGYTLIMGFLGAVVGNKIACSLGKETDSRWAKLALNGLIAPITSAMFGVFGYHSHVLKAD